MFHVIHHTYIKYINLKYNYMHGIINAFLGKTNFS